MKIVFSSLLIFTSVLFCQTNDKWLTEFEKSGYLATSDYNQTIRYFQELADNSSYADLYSFGVSPQGRELKYLIVTNEKTGKEGPRSVSEGFRISKAAVLIINGIHPGEIEGKDATMLLLREILISREKEYILDSINIIVIPVFSVDGHERKSKFNRINQNGPENMGWRTTAQNYNLNRDWMKADAPEMQAVLRLFNKLKPDFVIDTHTTDGADYQYDVTYQVEKFANMFHETALMLKNRFVPYLEKNVEKKGFLIFPYVGFRNWEKGEDISFLNWASGPRLSTGYFALHNRPALLVETHMIKPYKERVFSTRAVLETVLEFVFENAGNLRELNQRGDYYSENQLPGKYLPLAFNVTDRFEEVVFKGFEYYGEKSEISGAMKTVYTDKPSDIRVKYFKEVIPSDSVKTASGYFIPMEYGYLAEKMKLHGIEYSILTGEKRSGVLRYRFRSVKFSEKPFEGRQRVSFDIDTYAEDAVLPAGTIYISMNQRTSRLITALLEPKSDDSFVKWGFINQIFEQKEYFEEYVMERIAIEMLENDERLKEDFESRLAEDEAFRNDPYERLNYFYQRSPYWDKHLNLYPVMRID